MQTQFRYAFDSIAIMVIDVFEEKEPSGVSLFVSNTTSYGSLHFDADDEQYVINRDDKESFNFANGTTLGIELPISGSWFVQSGIHIDIISSTYRHRQEGIVLGSNFVQHDTAVIYNNVAVPGTREVTEVASRKIVKNNEVIKLGIPVMAGFDKDFGAWSLRALVGARFNFSQSFYGVISDMDGVHMESNEEINNTYYGNTLGVKPSASAVSH